MNENGWPEYRRLVLAELKRLEDKISCLERKIDAARLDLSALKGRASVWGAVGGVITAGLVSIGVAVIAQMLGG